MEQVTSVLQRVKDENGNYVVTLHYNTMDEVLDSLESGRTLRQINTEINDKQEGLLDDLATVLYNLAGLLDNKMDLNQIYRENFKDTSNLNITSGVFEQGCVRGLNNQTLEFSLKNPKELRFKPEKFKLKHMIAFIGNPRLSVEISFNALDSVPRWFDATEAIITSSFLKIPEINNKEENVPYAMNMRVNGTCDSTSSIEISDVMVLMI